MSLGLRLSSLRTLLFDLPETTPLDSFEAQMFNQGSVGAEWLVHYSGGCVMNIISGSN